VQARSQQVQPQRRLPGSHRPTRIALEPVAEARLHMEKSTPLSGRSGDMEKIGFGREVEELRSSSQTAKQLAWTAVDHGRIAAVTLVSPKAAGLRLGLLIETLPDSAVLRFYVPEKGPVIEVTGRQVMETIARNIKAGDHSEAGRTYWSPPIAGEAITVEIELPAGVSPQELRLSMPRLMHVYDASPPAARAARAGSDGEYVEKVDATCMIDTWGKEMNATMKIQLVKKNQIGRCTGTLVDDNDPGSSTPYVVTANHCIETQTMASNAITAWFYRSSACNSTEGSDYYDNKLHGGATLLYTSGNNETTLLRLNEPAPAKAYFAGWTAEVPTVGTGASAIHHGGGQWQQYNEGRVIGYDTCTASTKDVNDTYFCLGYNAGYWSPELAGVRDPNPDGNNHIDVMWDRGSVAGGSSGGGLFITKGDRHYLAGVLHGGGGRGPDDYGRFDLAYRDGVYKWLAGDPSVKHTLAVSRLGAGVGKVRSEDGSIDCAGSQCKAEVASSRTVTLTALPAKGASVSRWKGCDATEGDRCTVYMGAKNRGVIVFFNNSRARQSIEFEPVTGMITGATGSLAARAVAAATGGTGSSPTGLPVAFSSLTPETCSVAGNTITGLAVGTCTLAANAKGNDQYLDAKQTTRSVPVVASGEVWSNGFESPADWSIEKESWTRYTTGAPFPCWWALNWAAHNPDAFPRNGARMAALFAENQVDRSLLHLAKGFTLPDKVATVKATFWVYRNTGEADKKDRVQMQVSVDGGAWENAGAVIPRGGATGWTQASVDLTAYQGKNVRLGFLGIAELGQNIYLDDLAVWAEAGTPPPPPVSYEAEALGNTLAGGAKTFDSSACSGSKGVGWMGSLTFSNVSAARVGQHTLTIDYLSGENRNLQISVNGGTATALSNLHSGGWDKVARMTVSIDLKAGDNSIKFYNDSGNAPNLDRITVMAPGTPQEPAAVPTTRLAASRTQPDSETLLAAPTTPAAVPEASPSAPATTPVAPSLAPKAPVVASATPPAVPVTPTVAPKTSPAKPVVDLAPCLMLLLP